MVFCVYKFKHKDIIKVLKESQFWRKKTTTKIPDQVSINMFRVDN
jgi:hypothetical protein